MNYCPLCGEPVRDKYAAHPESLEFRSSFINPRPQSQFQRLTGIQQRKLVWEIIGIILVSGGFITMIIDLISHGTISWSKYPVATCLVVFIHVTLIAFWNKRIIALLSGGFIASSALLFFIDIYTGGSGWGINLGIPLLFAAYLVVYGFVFLIRRIRQYGLNLIAIILITSGLLCLCMDGIISLYARHTLQFGWSLIVMVSILPVAAFLFLVHFRLMKGTDLKRFFHI